MDGASKVKLNQATSCWFRLFDQINDLILSSFDLQCTCTQSRILAIHISHNALQSRFTEQFFSTSRFMDTKNDQKWLSLPPPPHPPSFKSIDLIKVMLEDAVSKLIAFKKFFFSLINLLNEPRLGEFLNELGRRIQHKVALCLTDDQLISVFGLRNLNVCRLPKIIIRLRFNNQISKRMDDLCWHHIIDIKTNN